MRAPPPRTPRVDGLDVARGLALLAMASYHFTWDLEFFGYIEPGKQAVFGRSYAAEPDKLIEELKQDTAIQAADTLLLTVPNQLGVAYNAHVIESILKHVAPALGWR